MYNCVVVQPDPFATPDVVMKRLTLTELYDAYRQRVNKHYMPSATGERSFNSKPEYVTVRDPNHPEFPELHFTSRENGFFAFDTFGRMDLPKEVFAHLKIDNLQLVTNLTSLATIVRLIDHGATGERPVFNRFVAWPLTSQQSLGVDRIKLEQILDTYF